MVYTTGYRGEGVRSDCFISIDTSVQHGISIEINSKVKSLYGKANEDLCQEMLKFFEIKNATLLVEDQGALPFTLAARLEAAIKKFLKTDREYLLPVEAGKQYTTAADADRITRLYLPGNNPKLMINAGIYGSNGIILDLEDAVMPERKFEARFLVRNALRAVDFYGAERMVRINQLPMGLDDLLYCVPHVNLILIPKCEKPDEVRAVDARISQILGTTNTSIHLMPIIESAAGILSAREIACASDNVVALAIGLEDYTADLGVPRTQEGKETFFARSMVVHAAVAAGIQPIDSVFSDIDNMENLAAHASASKAMGFSGMGCIHPRQVPVVNAAFLPSDAEIEKACKIAMAFSKAQSEGLSVIAVDSKMIDPPVVKRALKTIERAVKSGKLSQNWRETYE